MSEEGAASLRRSVLGVLEAGPTNPAYAPAVMCAVVMFDSIVGAGKDWPDLLQVRNRDPVFSPPLCRLPLGTARGLLPWEMLFCS